MAYLGMRMEVIQGSEPGHQRGQRSGNVRIAGIREVVLSVHPVVMDFRMKRLRYLACVSAKVHKKATLRHLVEFEPLLHQPLGDLAQVLARRPESLAELLRCQPLMELARARVVLAADELLQVQFLGLAAAQHHQNVFHGQAIGRQATVKLGTGSGAGVPRRAWSSYSPPPLGRVVARALRRRPRRGAPREPLRRKYPNLGRISTAI